ncbi:MAG: SAM-dependent methyltransferase [Hyphomicrobium sp.]
MTDLSDEPQPYDPRARRDTPLAAKLRDEIRRAGTLSLPQFMSACLADPDHGYYRTRQAIGAQGDFITAPEISQIFGELIGLWSVVTWQQMGSPASFRLIELGPGRGTLMGDALRAARVVPGFLDAVEICLVDINPTLRAAQQTAIAAALADKPPRVTWHDTVTSIYWDNPDALSEPAILIGNEFLDTCPIFQFTRRGDGWLSRRVGLDDDGRLQFAEPQTAKGPARPRPDSTLDALYPAARDGDIVAKPQFEFLDSDVMPWQRLAALFIDYGHPEPAPGDTLQAIRNHAFEHPLTSPGEADLTAHVDFSAIARRLEGAGSALAIDGTTTQAEFLGSLGIMERASRLMAANPGKAGEIEMGVARLMAVPGMGSRFKAVGIRSPDLPPLPGF